MVKSVSIAIGIFILLGLFVAGCTEAPRIPHDSEGLEAVDCLACHELGLQGAPKISERHLDDEGTVQHDNCDCHKPMPPQESTPSDEASRTILPIELAGLVLAPVGFAAFGLLLARRR